MTGFHSPQRDLPWRPRLFHLRAWYVGPCSIAPATAILPGARPGRHPQGTRGAALPGSPACKGGQDVGLHAMVGEPSPAAPENLADPAGLGTLGTPGLPRSPFSRRGLRGCRDPDPRLQAGHPALQGLHPFLEPQASRLRRGLGRGPGRLPGRCGSRRRRLFGLGGHRRSPLPARIRLRVYHPCPRGVRRGREVRRVPQRGGPESLSASGTCTSGQDSPPPGRSQPSPCPPERPFAPGRGDGQTHRRLAQEEVRIR